MASIARRPIFGRIDKSFPTKLLCATLTSDSTCKPYSAIPTKKSLLPSWSGLVLSGGPGYLHEHCDKRHKELGPIYRESLGPTELVFLADTKLIQIVLANEGQYPHHNVPQAWTFYNSVHKVERGLFFQTGEPWAKIRKALNKVFLSNSNILKFGRDILEINRDLLDSWVADKSSPHNKEVLINDAKWELCKWSIEATGFMLFGNRMGCFSSRKLGLKEDPKADELVTNVANMFAETSNFQVLPVKLAHRFNLSTWKRFETASANMLLIANDYVQENISRVKSNNPKSGLMGEIMAAGELDEPEVARSMVDLIIAAADTTSNSLQWMLYLLGKHQDIQFRIFGEISPLMDGEPHTIVEKAPFLRAFVREASRLYPTAPFLARSLDKEIMLGGYRIPAGKHIVFSLYTTSRMEKYFDDPLEFKPDRWLRTGGSEKSGGCPKGKNHAYASLPFGIGARNCIGRRAAELEMSLYIASFVERFKCYLVGPDEVKVKLKMILCPENPIKLKLKIRTSETELQIQKAK